MYKYHCACSFSVLIWFTWWKWYMYKCVLPRMLCSKDVNQWHVPCGNMCTTRMCDIHIRGVQWGNIAFDILPLQITYSSLVKVASLSHGIIGYFKCIFGKNLTFAFPRIEPMMWPKLLISFSFFEITNVTLYYSTFSLRYRDIPRNF